MLKKNLNILLTMFLCLCLGFFTAKMIYTSDRKGNENKTDATIESLVPKKNLPISSSPDADVKPKTISQPSERAKDIERQAIEKMNAEAEDVMNKVTVKLPEDEILVNGHAVKRESIIGEWISVKKGKSFLLSVSPFRLVFLETCEKHKISGKDDILKCEKIFEGVVASDNIPTSTKLAINELKGDLKNHLSGRNSSIILRAKNLKLKMSFDDMNLDLERGNKKQIALQME